VVKGTEGARPRAPLCSIRAVSIVRLELLGEHTRLASALCERCPIGPTGCCASPPGVEWSDLGRIVSLGGRSFLLEQIEAGALRVGARGLLYTRVPPKEGEGPLRCVYHGPRGCTIDPARRAATCNYYLCDDGFARGGEAEGDAAAIAGRRALDSLVALYGQWDQALAKLVRARWPGGPPWDAAFLDWLGSEYQSLVRGSRRALGALKG
jgi:hypothetical protein